MIPIILISLLGGFIYLIWMIITAVKRRWRKLGYQFLAALCYFAVLWAADIANVRYVEAKYLAGLFNVSVKLPEPLFSYDSPRAFNGDGYSIAVYALPREIKNRFVSFDEKEMAGFPVKPDYRSHWKTVYWRKTPSIPWDTKYIEFALSPCASDKDGRLAETIDAIRLALAKKGSFIAYFYFDHTEYPGDIDLFLIDLEGDRLCLINQNT